MKTNKFLLNAMLDAALDGLKTVGLWVLLVVLGLVALLAAALSAPFRD